MNARSSANRRIAVVALVLLTTACSGADKSPTASNPATVPEDTVISPLAKHVLDQLIDIVEAKSIRRGALDIAQLRSEASALAKGVQDPERLNPAILHVMTVIDDRHSRYISRQGTTVRYRPVDCTLPGFPVSAVPPNIGYVHVDFIGGTVAEETAYANALQDSLRSQDKPTTTGWIVDLRGNTGGNMWPMLAGIGPLLGDTVAGFFVTPDGGTEKWTYRNGVSYLVGQEQRKTIRPYTVRNPSLPVAVLTDKFTASSGEAVAVAFHGRDQTRFFGTETCGQSTAIDQFELFDHSNLLLAVATMADRTRRVYGGVLTPDEVITVPGDVMPRAIAWLQAQR